MDYKDYLGGNVREELDRLNGFEGKFLIDTSELMVKREGKNLSKEEWRYIKPRMPTDVISFLNGKKDFRICEKRGRSGERECQENCNWAGELQEKPKAGNTVKNSLQMVQ